LQGGIDCPLVISRKEGEIMWERGENGSCHANISLSLKNDTTVGWVRPKVDWGRNSGGKKKKPLHPKTRRH